ncbi:MAG: precorrin-6y C5,15-methyltransferase (decarboxylating) subunit CbiE [Desulfobulbaceae bacterium]|nr:precorrin-6y C5,15-methyltransferase (decarboxylating) subunit CbiE [Desulfobulbaceae bacterium]
MPNLYLIGIDAQNLSQSAREILGHSTCVFCTERLRQMLCDFPGEIMPISPLSEALLRMAISLERGDIAVLASGDPLFFGIGRTLLQRFGKERVVIRPALSSMQLAFSHCREPWEDAAFLSLHGRGDKDILPTLLRQKKLFLLTDQKHQPQSIAAEISRGLTGLGIPNHDCQIMVAENLGLTGERITHGSPEQVEKQHFSDLNVMILRLLVKEERTQTIGPLGLQESEIQHSRGLITKDEVRAAILHRLRLPTTGVFWDIGAGSGSISCEAARLCPGLTVYAIERHDSEQANILANRKTFRLANLHLIPGLAPEALRNLPAPDRVFIGGSGGQLPTIVETVSTRLNAHGIIILSAVTESTRQMAPGLFHQHGLQVEIATISVSRETYPPLASRTITLNPITLITGSK